MIGTFGGGRFGFHIRKDIVRGYRLLGDVEALNQLADF